MMTQTQKKAFEIPILIFLVWIIQIAEIWILRLPFESGALQVVPIVITYIALTRSWGRLALICTVLAFVASFTVGYSKSLFVAVQVWAALATKLFSSEFAIEGRFNFASLAGGAHLFSKLTLWFLLKASGEAPSLGYMVQATFFSLGASMIFAYLIFPFLVGWDEYFEHPIAESRELNPDVLR
jgi:hypothetical protein